MRPIFPRVKGPTRHHPDLDRRSGPFVLIIPALNLGIINDIISALDLDIILFSTGIADIQDTVPKESNFQAPPYRRPPSGRLPVVCLCRTFAKLQY